MSTEANKALVRRVLEEIWHAGNLAAVAELFATDYVNHNPATAEVRDRTGYQAWAGALRAAMPDMRIEVAELIAEGDRVVKRFTTCGTQTGELLGIPPTGKLEAFTGITIYQIGGGKVAGGGDHPRHHLLPSLDLCGHLQRVIAAPPRPAQRQAADRPGLPCRPLGGGQGRGGVALWRLARLVAAGRCPATPRRTRLGPRGIGGSHGSRLHRRVGHGW